MNIVTKQSAETILHSIYAHSNDLIVVTDSSGRRLTVSDSYRRLFGESPASSGTDVISDIHPEDRGRVEAFFKSRVDAAGGEKIEYRLLLPDGNTRRLQSQCVPIPGEKSQTLLVVISRDITEQIQVRKELRLLAQAVNCTRDSFILSTMEDVLLFVNPATCEMYGYDESELIGKKIELLRSPNNSQKIISQIYPATVAGGWNGEILNRRKDGTDFPVELWTSVVRDDAQVPVALVCVARDISARREAHERFLESSARLQMTMDNLDIITYELDANGIFLLSRGKGLEKLGLKPDQLLNRSAFETYRENEDMIRLLKRAYSGEPCQKDIEAGGFVWSANVLPLKGADGNVERVFGTAIDITDRKKAEKALIHESELWHTLMDNIPDTIYFKDVHSRFTLINRAQAEVLRVAAPEEAIGKMDHDYFDADHANLAYADEQQVMRTGKPILGKPERVLTNNGRVFWFSTTKVPMRDGNGRIIGVVGSSRDITELKHAEELELALYRIAEEAGSEGDLKTLFSTIHGIVGDLMYAKNFYIALYDDANDILSFPYFVDEVDTPPDPGTAGRGLTAYVLRKGKSLLCDQNLSDELERIGEAELVGVNCPIWLGVPLIVEGKTIGAMVVQHYTDGTAYGEREKHILEFVSTQVAKAIERKQAHEALMRSEDRYRAFVEQSTEGIWRFETDVPVSVTLPVEEQIKEFYNHFYLADCNDSMAQMYGYLKAKELIGRKLTEMLVMGDPRNEEIFRNFIQSNYRLTQAESHEVDRFGNIKFFLNNFVGRIEHNHIHGWWGTQIDVTERRHAEESLIHSEQKYRTLFEESQDCIILSTPDGKLADINPAGVGLFGYGSKEELLSSNDADALYTDPADREAFMSHFEQYQFVKDLEVSIRHKNGEKRIVLENASAVRDGSGNVIAYRSFLRDITERKKLEDQLRQAQKMESIGTLAGGIAHDFNNILGIILGYATVLERGTVEPERVLQSLAIIKKAVQRGADLVRQLLTFARKGEPSFSSVNVNEVTSELARMLKQTFPKSITVECRVCENPPEIIADPGQIHLALLNLCVNARDAMVEDAPGSSGSGVLTLETGILNKNQMLRKFADASAGEYASISVRDTGVGMDDVTRNRMFEPFFTTKALGKGTGLGLAVVYGVVSSHHGHVEVESVKGSGSIFTLYFPTIEKKTEAGPQPAAEEQTVDPGSETILIVEDEEMLSTLLASILSDQGYTILTAKDGQEGVEIFSAQPENIDLVLSDMGLPRLGGYEMFMKMKEVKPGIKAILASGYFDPNLKKDLLDAGAKDFIQKPYVPEMILQRIREILDESK